METICYNAYGYHFFCYLVSFCNGDFVNGMFRQINEIHLRKKKLFCFSMLINTCLSNELI